MRDLFFNTMHEAGVARLCRRLLVKKREVVVLMFHRISDNLDPLWPPMPVNSFHLLMENLRKTSRIQRIDEVTESHSYGKKPLVVLTFDDGYRDFMENALPILLDLEIPACHNICPKIIDTGVPPWTQVLSACLVTLRDSHLEMPDGARLKIPRPVSESFFLGVCEALYRIEDGQRSGWIDHLTSSLPKPEHNPMMTWDDVNKCLDIGILIGSHGYSHRNLSQLEDRKLLEREVGLSRIRIHEKTGTAPTVFAFPNGLYNACSLDAVKKSGYSIALLCDDTPASFEELKNSDRFKTVPRLNIGRANWREESLRSFGFHYRLNRNASASR